MSWSLFKANIIRKTNPYISKKDYPEVAKIWAQEYDAAVKRGKDFINFESVQSGNKALMESFFKIALLKGLATIPGANFSLPNEFGTGVKAYWAGAQMRTFPIPLIPAPGSIQNIVVNSNVVINAGTWPMYPPLKPVRQQAVMIDMFILAAIVHLFSIGGIIQTTSLYPSVPSPIPAPGVISWTGYLVPPAIPIPNINFPSEDGSEPPIIEIPESDVVQPINTNNSNVDGGNDTNIDGTNNVDGDNNIGLGGDSTLQNVINVSLPDMSVESFDRDAYIASFQKQLEDDGCCCD